MDVSSCVRVSVLDDFTLLAHSLGRPALAACACTQSICRQETFCPIIASVIVLCKIPGVRQYKQFVVRLPRSLIVLPHSPALHHEHPRHPSLPARVSDFLFPEACSRGTTYSDCSITLPRTPPRASPSPITPCAWF